MNAKPNRFQKKQEPSQVQLEARRLIREALKKGMTDDELRAQFIEVLSTKNASTRKKQIALAIFENELRAARQ